MYLCMGFRQSILSEWVTPGCPADTKKPPTHLNR